MARKDYLVEGGLLECTLGTAPGEMLVTSQQRLRIKTKLKATSADKTLKPPFFGTCTCSSPNPPCSPVLQEWQQTSQKATMGTKTFLLNTSKVQCSKGGLITVKNTGQKLVGTGKDEAESDDVKPKLEGEIIFANGYLSSSLGGSLNAMLDLHPDDPNPKLYRGHNVNEANKIDPEDIQLHSEVEEINALTDAQIEQDEDDKKLVIPIAFPVSMMPPTPSLRTINIKFKVPKFMKAVPDFTQKEFKDTFYGYWNSIENDNGGSDTYAKYFNATKQHFLNGSHGLGSNAAHRLDHGLAQGYHWARFQWAILPKQEVEETKKKMPYIESFSPAYKPITVVMHSQGNAPGVGFALGVMKYANELGWDKMPLNLVFLGVHQPKNLWEEDYDNFVDVKVKHYLADTTFLDSISGLEKMLFINGDLAIKSLMGLSQYIKFQKDRNILKYLNGLAELYNPKYHKLRHKRGIFEHLKAITDFNAIKDRAVQFTFTNDRGDMVIRDGDIPHIDSACDPNRDTTLYSVEFFHHKVPEGYATQQNKEIIPIDTGGYLVIPPYAVNMRIHFDEKTGDKEYWKKYREIAKDWGKAMSQYHKAKKEYQRRAGQDITLNDILDIAMPGRWFAKKLVKELKLDYWYSKVIFHYARIQMADLYAHFSPVGLINDKEVLTEAPDFNDALGNKNIFERITQKGAQKFYRVEYSKSMDKKNLTDDQKIAIEKQRRKEASDYINGDGRELLINTAIADTPYIQNVINAYVYGDAEAEKQLYQEPVVSDKTTEARQNLMGSEAQRTYQQKLEQEKQALLQQKQDNIPKIKPLYK